MRTWLAIVIVPLLAGWALFAAPALAQTTPNGAPPPTSGGQTGTVVTLKNPLSVKTVPELVNNIIRTFVGIVGALALLVFIYGGFRWLTSGGDAGKITAGKDAMKWAAVGLAVIFTSYALVRFVFSAITG